MVEYPMPTRPCRGTPERNATQIATSPGASPLRSSARMATLRERDLVSATWLEAVTTSANRVIARSDDRSQAVSGEPCGLPVAVRDAGWRRDGAWRGSG